MTRISVHSADRGDSGREDTEGHQFPVPCTNPNDLPPDPSPNIILGLQKHQLPERFRQYFSDDDIIFFKHRTLSDAPDTKKPRKWDGAWGYGHCFLDQCIAWAMLVFYAILSVPLGLSLFSSPFSITNPAIIGLLATIFIQASSYAFIQYSLDLVFDDRHKDKFGWPDHLVEHISYILNSERFDNLLANVTERLEDFWDTCEYFEDCPNGSDDNPLVDWSKDMFSGGMLVLRLNITAVPYAITLLSRVPWVGPWVCETYYNYKSHQQSFAAREAYEFLENEGALRNSSSLSFPKEYSIEELGEKLADQHNIFLMPTWSFRSEDDTDNEMSDDGEGNMEEDH